MPWSDRRTKRSAWRAVPATVGMALAGAGCSSPSSPTAPLPRGETIVLDRSSVLVFRDGGQLSEWRGAIEALVRQTLEAVSPLLRLDHVRIEIRAGRQYAIPEIGFGGRADAGTVRLDFDPSAALTRSLETELPPLLAHELHHVARFRTAGFADNLLEAMVTEGLADRFSVQVAGVDPPPWASALSGAALEEWLARARRVWLLGSYDHSAWFFGTSPEIPRWTGYTVGFEIVGRYLAANPGRRPSDLVAEPALSFVSVAP